MGCCKIQNEFYYFTNHENNKNHRQITTLFSQNINKVITDIQKSKNDHVLKESDMTKHINAEEFIPKESTSDENKYLSDYVKISKKITLEPKETAYVKTRVQLTEFFLNKDIVLIPQHELNNITVEEAIYSFTPKPNQEKRNFNNNQGNLHFLHALITNNSNETIHIQKDTKIGNLNLIEDLKSNLNTQELINKPPPNSGEYLNVILPTPEIIKLRKEEFEKSKVNLNHLSDQNRKELENILKQNYQAFSSSLLSLGHSDLIEPQINFNSDYPVKALPFPIPQALQAETKKQIEEMVEAGLIEKNIATWACPMLLVKKKSDGSGQDKYRMTLDLRLLNAIIQHSSYPLPKIQQIIANLANYKYFTLLDMPSAYHQIDLPQKYQDRICFTSPFGTYKLKRMPQGLKTSAGNFQALADLIIEEINMPGVGSYIDDFIIGSNSFEETIKKLEKLLKTFQKHNLTLNLDKCTFHTTSINYLGFKIEEHKIHPVESNIIKINSFPKPKSKRHVKKFLGLCGFYRHLIPMFAKIADPLIKLTSPKEEFKWDSVADEAFEKMQKVFFSEPFLKQPNFNKTFYLNTDASAIAISGVLLQKYGKELLPVAYFSKAIRKAETRYPGIKLELMAIVKSINAFKYILYGREFFILSDSKPLEHYRKTSSPADITTRWLLELSEYSFKFDYIEGKKNILADYFSRIPVDKNSTDLNSDQNIIHSQEILPIIQEEVNTLNAQVNNVHNSPPNDALLDISIPTIIFEQDNDKNLKSIINELNNNRKSRKHRDFLICKKTGLLLIKSNEKCKTREKVNRIVVPEKLKEKCLQISHLPHYGIDKTYHQISKKYFWKGMYRDVENYVKSCVKCLTTKYQRIPVAPFQETYIPERPGQFLSLDFVGPFFNNQHILTVIDHFSKHIKLYPLKNITAMNTIHAIFDYITTFGRPELILSDNGKQFVAYIFEEFNKMLGVKISHTTVAHPEGNSVSERINASIKATIKALMKEGYNFEHAIKIHENLYNNTYHNTIKMTPNKVHFGRAMSSIIDTFHPHLYQQRLDVHQDYFQLMNNLQKLYEEVHINLKNFQQLQNKTQHMKAKLRDIKVNDIVYLDKGNKFKRAFQGPFRVVEKCSDVNFKIQWDEEPNSRIQTVHINRLLLAPSREKYHLSKEVADKNPTDKLILAPPVPDVSIDRINKNEQSSTLKGEVSQNNREEMTETVPNTEKTDSRILITTVPVSKYNLRKTKQRIPAPRYDLRKTTQRIT